MACSFDFAFRWYDGCIQLIIVIVNTIDEHVVVEVDVWRFGPRYLLYCAR